MYTGPLYMLHYPGDKDIMTVAYGIDLKFLAHEILVDKNRMLLRIAVYHRHEFFYLLIRNGDLHPLSAKYI